MAYSFTAASSMYLSVNSAPVTALPLTISIWGLQTSTATKALICMGNKASANRTQLQFNSANTVSLSYAGTLGAGNITSVDTISNDIWYNLCVVAESATLRTLYLNGVSVGTSTVNAGVPSAYDNVSIGSRFFNNSNGVYFNGYIAEAAIYDAALSAEDLSALAKGYSPQFVRPQNLQFYAPLIRDLTDIRKGVTITNNNTATVIKHPRMYG
jgi:hypothetical protein